MYSYENQMEQMQRLYERFLDCGHTPDLFYRISINEAVDLIESYNRTGLEQQKEKARVLVAVMDVFGGNLIEKAVMAFRGREQAEGMHFSLAEYFPELFPTDDTADGRKEDMKGGLPPEMLLYKAQRMQHAYQLNRERKKKEEEQYG